MGIDGLEVILIRHTADGRCGRTTVRALSVVCLPWNGQQRFCVAAASDEGTGTVVSLMCTVLHCVFFPSVFCLSAVRAAHRCRRYFCFTADADRSWLARRSTQGTLHVSTGTDYCLLCTK